MKNPNQNPNHPLPDPPHGPPPGHCDPHDGPHSTVTIVVNDAKVSIRPGAHTADEIKRAAGVPMAYDLDQKVDDTLKKLGPSDKVVLKGGEVFVAYPSDGASS